MFSKVHVISSSFVSSMQVLSCLCWKYLKSINSKFLELLWNNYIVNQSVCKYKLSNNVLLSICFLFDIFFYWYIFLKILYYIWNLCCNHQKECISFHFIDDVMKFEYLKISTFDFLENGKSFRSEIKSIFTSFTSALLLT